MPYADPNRRKEYNDLYRQSNEGRQRIVDGKKRYWERLKADPARLEVARRKVREATRLRRMDPVARAAENARCRERWALKPKPQKEVRPAEQLDKKVWVSARHKPLFIENERTVRRGRPRKQKKVLPICDHTQGFKFQMTERGMKRTCNTCKRVFIEIAKR